MRKRKKHEKENKARADLSLTRASSIPFTSSTFFSLVKLSFPKLAKLPLGQKNLGCPPLSKECSTLESVELC